MRGWILGRAGGRGKGGGSEVRGKGGGRRVLRTLPVSFLHRKGIKVKKPGEARPHMININN